MPPPFIHSSPPALPSTSTSTSTSASASLHGREKRGRRSMHAWRCARVLVCPCARVLVCWCVGMVA
ncbi:hypothetical protein C8Q79DRAFT_979816 [Trametes meyenii]|nr:hypothetical protein C8Q79DRAFT_979816 [Trametes meyenii]